MNNRILCFINSLGSGGAQRQIVTIASELHKLGYDVQFLLYLHNDFYYNFLIKQGIKISYIEDKSRFKRFSKIRKFIRNGNFDVVLSFLVVPSLYSELSVFPYKRWKLYVGERSADPKIVNSWRSRLVRWFHIFADGIISNSNLNISLIRKACPLIQKSKCHIIYNAVSGNRFVYNKDYFFKKNDKLHIVVPASFRFLKNLSTLIEAVKLLTDQEKNSIRIDWYGSDIFDNSKIIDSKKIEEYCLNNVIFLHDAINNIDDIISNSDVVALFSKIEGFPNAICEGMYAGKPILCSNVSDIPLIVENGINGFVFDPNDIIDVKNKLSEFIKLDNSTLKKMSYMNHIRAIELFSINSVVKNYINLFNE